MKDKSTLTPSKAQRLLPDGTIVPIIAPARSSRSMTDHDIETAAHDDPDTLPLTPADFSRMSRVPRIKMLRQALGMTQEEFALNFHLPVGTIRDWEQGRTEPDQAAKAYLHVIAHDPEAVIKAFETA